MCEVNKNNAKWEIRIGKRIIFTDSDSFILDTLQLVPGASVRYSGPNDGVLSRSRRPVRIHMEPKI